MFWLIFIWGLILLTLGASWLTKGAVEIAARLRMSEYIIGLTVIAIGTSLPELTVSAASTISGKADIALGNIIGSNIFNIFVILGICSLIAPVLFSRANIRRDIPICIAASVALATMALDGHISRVEGVIMLVCYALVLLSAYRNEREAKKISADTTTGGNKEAAENGAKPFSWGNSVALIVLGLGALVYGAHLTLRAAIDIAHDLAISEAVISITILAAGSSFPELASSIAAAIKGRSSLALGTIIGSNVANILLILGVCATIKPLTISGITDIDLFMLAGASIILLLSALFIGQRRITPYEGLAYLAIYFAYIFYLLK